MLKTTHQKLSYQLIANPTNMIVRELESFLEVENLLNKKAVNIYELAGFIITGIEKAHLLFKTFSDQITNNENRPFLLDKFVGYLRNNLDMLDSKKNTKLDLDSDMFDIVADLIRTVKSIDSMFYTLSQTNGSTLNKILVCDTYLPYIKSLLNYLSTAQDWAQQWSVNHSKKPKMEF